MNGKKILISSKKQKVKKLRFLPQEYDTIMSAINSDKGIRKIPKKHMKKSYNDHTYYFE